MTDFEAFMMENNLTAAQLAIAKANLFRSAHPDPVPSYLYIGASKIEGEGVFTSCALQQGDELGAIWRHGWTQTGIKLNHSKEPNCNLNGMNLKPNREIAPNEELTINYREVKEALHV